MTNKYPTLLFDGDCGFCKRAIERWRPYLEQKIDISPYQEVIQNFPMLSEEECRESIRFVLDDQVYSGAHAIFKALAVAGKRKAPLWLYEHFPLFAPISEKVYSWVAKNRSRLSKFR